MLDYNLNASVANTCVFVQTDGFDYFILDNSQTFANPDPPKNGGLELFTIGR